jgi:tripartite-type tricarboxylate transporter receptor subunit TctC
MAARLAEQLEQLLAMLNESRPYKSAGLATSAVLSGEVQVLLTNMASVLPHVASGKLKVMGVSSLRRSEAAPEVPTLSESGLPRFEYATWYGMLVPGRTPPRIVSYLNASAVQALKAKEGLQIHASTPAEFDHNLKTELARWMDVVKTAAIRVD